MAKTIDLNVPGGFPIRGWLADCNPQFRREFLALAGPKSFPAGSVLYQSGDVGGDVFGIRSGTIAVQFSFTHPDAMLVQMLWPGEWLGTFAALVDQRRRITAVARTDVELLRVPGNDLRALLRRHPAWFAELGRDAVYWTELAAQGAADLLIRDASARCAAVLLRLAGWRWASSLKAGQAIEIPASQTEFAMLCNVSRKTFSRVVREFANRRLVTVGYRSLTVIDPARLRVVADAG